MFKHIAIPTDGSKLAERGVKAGIRLAQSLEAKVTGVYVVPPFRPPVRAARTAKCDAIAMASHGRGAVGGLIPGSETARVLSHSKLPVLVTR
jgi:nucleotide-binding universal stress UspA family protein